MRFSLLWVIWGAARAEGTINCASVSFSEHVITNTTLRGPCSVVAIDVDGDGDVDALSASKDHDDMTVAWFENDGSQSFTPRIITTLSVAWYVNPSTLSMWTATATST